MRENDTAQLKIFEVKTFLKTAKINCSFMFVTKIVQLCPVDPRPPWTIPISARQTFAIGCLITKFMKISCNENPELCSKSIRSKGKAEKQWSYNYSEANSLSNNDTSTATHKTYTCSKVVCNNDITAKSTTAYRNTQCMWVMVYSVKYFSISQQIGWPCTIASDHYRQ